MEGIVRGVEVLEGTGFMALDVACFNDFSHALAAASQGRRTSIRWPCREGRAWGKSLWGAPTMKRQFILWLPWTMEAASRITNPMHG